MAKIKEVMTELLKSNPIEKSKKTLKQEKTEPQLDQDDQKTQLLEQ